MNDFPNIIRAKNGLRFKKQKNICNFNYKKKQTYGEKYFCFFFFCNDRDVDSLNIFNAPKREKNPRDGREEKKEKSQCVEFIEKIDYSAEKKPWKNNNKTGKKKTYFWKKFRAKNFIRCNE